MDTLRLGILGTGNIAGYMASTVMRMPEVELVGAASRAAEKSAAFAEKYRCKRVYGTYEEMAADDALDLVYVATPMSEHYGNVRMLLEHGKNVLCEKAFAVTGKEAEEMIGLAEKKKLLLTEAMWVRYMPMAKVLQRVLSQGIIGEPKMLTANLGYLIDQVPRLLLPSLGGGGLLDIGVYTLNFASMVFGNTISSMDSTVMMTDTGVDGQGCITLCYPDRKMAALTYSIHSLSDRQGIVYGTDGFLMVENINNFEKICVYDKERTLIEQYFPQKQISGFEYQVLACKNAIEAGQIECGDMPHRDTLAVMHQMDEIRELWKKKAMDREE